MRVAALYDIHANLPALKAVIDEIRREKVDRIVVGGDVVPGPMPRETVDRLLGLDIPVHFIQGNCEVAVLGELAGTDPYGLPEAAREAVRWSAQQLDAEHARLFASWPRTLGLEIGALGRVLFCHATPRDENECFTRQTPEDRLRPVFGEIDARVVVCGHTHMQFDRMIGDTRVVNAGSVGMPFGMPGAYWLVLGPGAELRRTRYDFVRAAERIRNTSYPQAEDFAAHNVLQPPSERDMLEAFRRVELK